MDHDLIIRNARLRSGRVCDICISKGHIEAITEKADNSAGQIIDVQNRLVSEPFIIAHLHLDKVLTGSLIDDSSLETYHGSSMTGAMTAIELASKVKEHYVESEIISRVRKVLAEAERNGVSHIRAFVDVDPKARLIALDAMQKIKQEFKGRIEIEIVAFPQDGIIREPGTEELLYKAMEHGADVVGGIPWIEYTEEESRKHVDIGYEIAMKFNADISMLTDDAGDPDLRTTEYLAASATKNNWTGRISACHARASALYNGVYHSKFVALLKKTGVGVITNPHTGPLHVRVKELINGGVTVALSQDDVGDAYYPYGRCNMLEVAFLASHLLWMMSRKDRELIYDMITINAAKIMRLPNYGLSVGNPANLLVLDASDLQTAFSYHSEPLYVIRNGIVTSQP